MAQVWHCSGIYDTIKTDGTFKKPGLRLIQPLNDYRRGE